MTPQDMADILQIMCRFELARKRLKLIEEFDSTLTLFQLRLRILEPTFVIGLARNRKSTFERDEIYGLMSAAGVVINTTAYSVENAWEAWWESALRKGHVVWAMLPGHADNCVMPSYKTRCDTLWESRVTSKTLVESIEVHRGTVSIMGRNAGRCSIDTYLGPSKRGQAKNFLNAALASTSGNLSVISRLYAAMSTGRFSRAELEAKAEWRCARYQWETDSIEPTEVELASMEARFGKERPISLSVSSTGNAFLGTITNEDITTDIILYTEPSRTELPKGKMLALDVGARDGSRDSETGIFMIVLVPEREESATGHSDNSLHRIGITNPITLFGETETTRAAQWNGYIYRTGYERHFIGGKSCHFCFPST
jgi:hypothetical protein